MTFCTCIYQLVTMMCFLVVFTGLGRQQLRLRTAGAVLVAVCARGSKHRLVGPVGDRSVQAAKAVAEWRSLQTYLRNVDWLQEHCFKNC